MNERTRRMGSEDIEDDAGWNAAEAGKPVAATIRPGTPKGSSSRHFWQLIAALAVFSIFGSLMLIGKRHVDASRVREGHAASQARPR